MKPSKGIPRVPTLNSSSVSSFKFGNNQKKMKNKFKFKTDKVLAKQIQKTFDKFYGANFVIDEKVLEGFFDLDLSQAFQEPEKFFLFFQEAEKKRKSIYRLGNGLMFGPLSEIRKRVKKFENVVETEFQRGKSEDQELNNLVKALHVAGIKDLWPPLVQEMVKLIKNQKKMKEFKRIVKMQGFW